MAVVFDRWHGSPKSLVLSFFLLPVIVTSTRLPEAVGIPPKERLQKNYFDDELVHTSVLTI